MHRDPDWNHDNFKGLVALAAALRGEPRMKRLALYCELCEQGLRREAFAELEAFLDEAGGWEEADRRDVALRILDADRRSPAVDQFLCDPPRRRLIEPVLETWRAAEPDSANPIREHALVRHNQDLLDAALRADPHDDEVRAAIAKLLVRFVDYATQHLDQG